MIIRTRAFTLFEMLLVVTVLSIIAGIGALTIRNQSNQQRYKAVAEEMQQVAQAAIAFNEVQGVWPRAYPCTDNTPPVGAEAFINDYLPNDNTISRLGTHFCWNYDHGNATGSASPSDPRFYVALAVDPSIGHQIADQLPNTYLVNDPTTFNPTANSCTSNTQCFLRMSLVIPGPTSNEGASGQHSAGAGPCSSSTTASIPGTIGNTQCTFSSTSPVNPGDANGMLFTITGSCPPNETGLLLMHPVLERARTLINYGTDDEVFLEPYLLDRLETNMQPCTGVGVNVSCSVAVNAWAYAAVLNEYRNILYYIPVSLDTARPDDDVAGTFRGDYTLYCMSPNLGAST